MIFYTVFVVVALVIYVLYFRGCFSDLGLGFVAFFGTLFSAVAFFVLMVIGLLISLVLPLNYETYYVEVISLKNSNDVQGSFFLGCGSINNQEYYYFFCKNKDGGIYRNKVRTDFITIYETATKTASYEEDRKSMKNNKIIPQWLDVQEGQKTNRKLIVPKGTIIRRMELF